jgi:hypothetical protein
MRSPAIPQEQDDPDVPCALRSTPRLQPPPVSTPSDQTKAPDLPISIVLLFTSVRHMNIDELLDFFSAPAHPPTPPNPSPSRSVPSVAAHGADQMI